MTYPQPDPNQYAIGGQKFWRLNTPLISDGDIYESEQGASGFAIGPDSDISKVNIAYFDDQVSGLMNQFAISPQRPFPGTLYARNDAVYVPSNRPGRFLLWPDELYNVNWRPTDFDESTMRIDFESVVLDVVQYFNPVGALGQSRNNKQYHYPQVPWPIAAGGTWMLVVPFYGRRYASVLFASVSSQAVTMSVSGLTYVQSVQSSFDDRMVTPILSGFVVAGNTNKRQIVTATQHGMFDALFIKFSANFAPAVDPAFFQMRIITSDTEA